MGPYCNFCGNRCFITMPKNTPTNILNAYKTYIPKIGILVQLSIDPIIATCQAGQEYEKNLTGYCFGDILIATQPKDNTNALS